MNTKIFFDYLKEKIFTVENKVVKNDQNSLNNKTEIKFCRVFKVKQIKIFFGGGRS